MEAVDRMEKAPVGIAAVEFIWETSTLWVQYL